jgi:hypothetical protein
MDESWEVGVRKLYPKSVRLEKFKRVWFEVEFGQVVSRGAKPVFGLRI